MITEELVDRLVEATNEAKATVRECHEARRDLRLLLRALDDKLRSVKAETESAFAGMCRAEWDRIFKEVNVTEMAAGLKQSFDQWVDLLDDAQKVLAKLQKRAGL